MRQKSCLVLTQNSWAFAEFIVDSVPFTTRIVPDALRTRTQKIVHSIVALSRKMSNAASNAQNSRVKLTMKKESTRNKR